MQVELYKEVNSPVQKRKVVQLTRTALRALRQKESINLSVAIVGEKTGKTLNKTWRGQNNIPSVLSYEEKNPGNKSKTFILPKQKEQFIGEIIITDSVIRKRAKTNKSSYLKEFEFLFIHGLLHLMGHTHKSSSKAKEMEKQEERILNLIHNT